MTLFFAIILGLIGIGLIAYSMTQNDEKDFWEENQ
jgi:hypothetical protein